MIYTITFSPSIDYVINTKQDFVSDGLNRVSDYQLFPGGKGINASVILKRIGFENKAISFLGDPVKNLFLELLKKEGLELVNIDVNEPTRINVKMFSNNHSFEINGKKPEITNNEFNKLNTILDSLNQDDIVLIMGICDESYLIEIVKKLNNKKIKFILDIDSSNMLELIKYQPYLIKPNLDELERILSIKINNEEQIKSSLLLLKEKGCINAMVSNGAKGSYLINDKNEIYKSTIQPIKDVVSTVGAGDTLISSFAALYLKSNNVLDSLKQATSLSIGTVKSKWLASREDLAKHLDKIEVVKIN
ncbi:1-phosphofructokinase family hexose kinase [Malacoplasma penetrans]|uniref:1-phosphofructokinase n=1 Tax=Malacoplasma penetrans (strain HF-2) TaxID=272633 RepID=Q8EUZ3_MALP2|nr:1-phosphofructokinase family hexose kinase [Malacoplasma penetrans]RXY96733.1 1-phosphofructokinase family hexose kinase [Malacoplasma penetrans]BAC44568.1 1-phosphofructokinase [Malacoplasma penetrans HF-2]